MARRDYLEFASKCLQMAQQADNSFERVTLLDITSKWLLLTGETAETRPVMDLLEPLRRSPMDNQR